eukprot:TRINITY_DN1182_c0_g1_i1.p1 TRINITY_DN1182_c0_g1~~TRINITY_DN1182_c0_g1_i1.p1  ORF type:complete len:184 (+),score=40.50 TRINITY_DN1182_c0_g1_i1:1156-1707(+)
MPSSRINKDVEDFTLQDLSKYFHKPIYEVSEELNICSTRFKKICRDNNVQRWPFRKVQSLDKMITDLKTLQPKNQNVEEDIKTQIRTLEAKRTRLMNDPNIPYTKLVPKSMISNYKENMLFHSPPKKYFTKIDIQQKYKNKPLKNSFKIKKINKKTNIYISNSNFEELIHLSELAIILLENAQ